jgi:hypothetical protein
MAFVPLAAHVERQKVGSLAPLPQTVRAPVTCSQLHHGDMYRISSWKIWQMGAITAASWRTVGLPQLHYGFDVFEPHFKLGRRPSSTAALHTVILHHLLHGTWHFTLFLTRSTTPQARGVQPLAPPKPWCCTGNCA